MKLTAILLVVCHGIMTFGDLGDLVEIRLEAVLLCRSTAWRMILEYLVTSFVEMILMHLDKSFWSRNHTTDTVEIGEQVLDEQDLVDIIKLWYSLDCLDTFHHLVRLGHCL